MRPSQISHPKGVASLVAIACVVIWFVLGCHRRVGKEVSGVSLSAPQERGTGAAKVAPAPGNAPDEEIRRQLEPFRPSPNELTAILPLKRRELQLAQRWAREPERRIELVEEMRKLDKAISEQLGPERYRRYKLTQTLGYAQVYAIVKKYGLAEDTLDKFVQLRDEVGRKAVRAHGLAVMDVAVEIREKMTELLGTQGYEDLRPMVPVIFQVPFAK